MPELPSIDRFTERTITNCFQQIPKQSDYNTREHLSKVIEDSFSRKTTQVTGKQFCIANEQLE